MSYVRYSGSTRARLCCSEIPCDPFAARYPVHRMIGALPHLQPTSSNPSLGEALLSVDSLRVNFGPPLRLAEEREKVADLVEQPSDKVVA